MKRNSKRFLSAVLTLVMFLTMIPLGGFTSFAATSGDFEYSVISQTKTTCEITGYTGSATNLTIPSKIDGYTVKSIGRAAFQHCYSLTSIVIPNGVTSIGDLAFLQCSELINITIPDSVTSIGSGAFSYCFSLVSITIPSGVTNISSETFEECYALKSVSIPNSVTNIGDRAFSGCYALANITIPNSVVYIGGAAFNDTAYYNDADNWENDVLYIGHYLIDAKNTISGAYTVKPETKIIAGAAFWYCTSLTSVTIPNSVISIGDHAFNECTSLTNVTIPNGVTNIGDDAFYGCTSLTSITIPDSVTGIGEFAFGYYWDGYENGNQTVDGFIIYGYTGSVAEIYAIENGFRFISLSNSATVSSVAVQSPPTKTTYTVGDKFDASGLTIKATMSDGTTKTLSSGFTVSTPDMSTAGTKTVTVSYGGKTATFTITVKAPVPPVGTSALRLDVPAHAVVGQKIQIPVMLENASIGTLMFTVKYDATKLKYVSCAESAFDMCDINPATAGILKAACIDGSAVLAGKVIVLTFEVIAPAACSTNLVLTVEEAYDGGDKTVSLLGGAWEMQIVKSVPGDVNGDGRVTAIDARWALQAASGTRELTDEQILAADVNGDGKVTAIDARWALQAASGTRVL